MLRSLRFALFKECAGRLPHIAQNDVLAPVGIPTSSWSAHREPRVDLLSLLSSGFHLAAVLGSQAVMFVYDLANALSRDSRTRRRFARVFCQTCTARPSVPERSDGIDSAGRRNLMLCFLAYPAIAA